MSANDVSQLSGQFTEQYAKKTVTLEPHHAYITSLIKFEERARVGNQYHQPVSLSRENGLVFNTDGTAFATTDPGPVAGDHADAQISGASFLMPTQVSYDAAAQALGGVVQFNNITKYAVERNKKGMGCALDMTWLYGQTGVATTTAVTASGTSGTFTVSQASWAPTFWAGSRNMRLDVFQNIGDAAEQNTNAAIIVTGVDLSTRVISFSCNASDAAALNALTTATIFRRRANAGSNVFREPAGFDKIITNTGTLFNIPAATYSDLWRGQTYDVGNNSLTFRHVGEGLAQAVNVGLEEDVVLLVSPNTWTDLNSDLSALRMLDGSYKSAKVEQGSKELVYYSQNGKISVKAYGYIKQGEAFGIVPSLALRLGATDVTYNMPGMPAEKLMLQLPNNAGYEFRSYTHQALFVEQPAKFVKFTGIVNSS